MPPCFFFVLMKAEVLQRSLILRYEGEYASLSSFRLAGNPCVADRETSDERGRGEVVFHGENDLTLTYREESSGITMSLKKTGEQVEIRRGGAELSFCVGRVSSFTYRTAYGNIPTEAIAEAVTLQKRGGSALLTITYTAVFAGMAQENELRFKITY